MRAHGRMTIRFRLGVALAIALMPVLALGGLQAFSTFQRDARQRQIALIDGAQRSAATARAQIQGAVALLETLTPQVVGAECTPRLAGVVQELRNYANIVRLDANGRVECSGASVAPNVDRAKRPWFVRLRAGAPIVIAKGSYLGEPVLLAAVRASRAGGRFDGALLAAIRLSSLKPDLSDPTLPRGTGIAIVTADGHVLVQTDANAFVPPPNAWRTRASAPGGLLYFGRDRSHMSRDVAAASLVDDVFVLLSAPAPGILFWARLNPFASLVYPLLAWAAAWAAVWIVSERVVVRWLAYLDRIASIYARGRFSVRPVQAESAPAEIRALAHTLDTMADTIVARDLSLRDSIAHKDALMREIHHRVKNNLQVITSLLNMQQRALADPAARAAMSDTRQRISALALIYRALYQSPDLRRVDVRQFLEELIAQLSAGDTGRPSPIRTELEADDLEIDPDKLAPLALFAVEAITNARKHAFGPSGGLIRVQFRVGADEATLEIVDDGGGPEMLASPGVGRTLMSAFARQLRGRAEIAAAVNRGIAARLIFPTPVAPPVTPPEGERDAPAHAYRGNQAAA